MAAHPLAYCPTCKIVFPIVPPQGRTAVFKNSTTSCPDGHFSRILNAAHQTFEAELRATLGIHHQPVRRPVLALWEMLTRREIEADAAQAEAERTRPGLGLIFNPSNFTDPVRKAIVEAMIADLGAEAEPEPPVVADAPQVPQPPQVLQPPQVPQIVVTNPAPAPKAETPREMLQPRRISNRAFQRHLRHQHRMLMNPRHH